jgi:hypothetical protein
MQNAIKSETNADRYFFILNPLSVKLSVNGGSGYTAGRQSCGAGAAARGAGRRHSLIF